ncbi:hemicentin-1-like [Mytilus trossulus]|uniref:hemicentin-1-like n=1 Tax=Mytilus trossulus TaxID=6551 RepID=UPI0030041B41
MIFSVNEGNKFGPLICNASCGPPCTFRWVGLVSVINSSQLLINNAARTDNGPYQCEARNTIGTITANIDLLVYYGPDKVILSPNETSLVANEGSDFPSIKCKADCHPGCTLTWIKPNGIEVSTNVLILKNIKMNQTGTYTCNASNFVGNMVSAGVTINLIDSPTILKLEILNSNTVDEQHSVNFLCEVNGYPVPDISWILSSTNTLLKKDEHTFKSNYVIPKANCLHTGTYRCQGSNVIEGELVNAFREINLFVLCRARIDQRYPEVADDIAVIENGDLNIKVFLLAYPEPMIIWTMRSSATGQDYTVNYINSFNSVEHMSIVNITDFSTKHYGVYKIIAYNNIGPPYVKSFTVKPQAIPSNICPNKMIFSVNEGNKFGPLICNASCGPPCTFRWVGLVSVINSSQLLINNAARTDNGPYQCEARNTIGTITANIDLLVYYGPDKVILSPNETSLVANEGSDFPSIKCKADCHPGCTLTWIKPNGIEVSTNVLILKNIKMNQTGTYTCNASNFVGNMVSAGVTINLIDSPTILKLEILNSNTVDEQHSVNFLCEVNGYPVPDISWILSSTNTLLKKDEHTFKSNYVIPKANCLHTGTYRCQGSNVIEGELVNAFREINLFVLCRARIDQRYPEVADDIAVIENGDLNIKVFLLAYPEPMIIWTMRSSATGQDYTVNYINSFNSVEHMSIVNITDFSTKHYGVYKIIAYNNIGPPYVKSFTVKPQGGITQHSSSTESSQYGR